MTVSAYQRVLSSDGVEAVITYVDGCTSMVYYASDGFGSRVLDGIIAELSDDGAEPVSPETRYVDSVLMSALLSRNPNDCVSD